MKYVMTEAVAPEGMALLDQSEKVYVAHDANPANYTEEMKDADALIVRAAPAKIVNKAVMEAAPQLKVIGRTGVGYDSVDVDAATELGIPVVITPGANNRAVAEHSLTLMLALSKNLVEAQVEASKGNWAIRDAHKQFELYGKKAGIIGLGRIGVNTAKILKAMNVNVIAYDAFQSEAGKAVADYVELDELLAKSDFIFLHCPLFPSTQGIIGKENIAKMKDGVIIINNSRGPLIVEQDLYDALESGKVAAAAVDVVSTEPIKKDNVLLKAKNCIITPHISWATKEARERIMNTTAENIKSVIDGAPQNVVNK